MVRAFVAINCPESVKGNILRIQEKLKDLGNLKLVEMENLHLTLRFLGEVSDEKLIEIGKKLDSISNFDKFQISLRGVGAFPNQNYIRVVWVGVDNGLNRIKEMHNKIENELNVMGFKKDSRFNSHLTIARVKSIRDKEKLQEILRENSKTEFGGFQVEKIELMKSELTKEGPIYSILREITLR